jgi:hypothetical protein
MEDNNNTKKRMHEVQQQIKIQRVNFTTIYNDLYVKYLESIGFRFKRRHDRCDVFLHSENQSFEILTRIDSIGLDIDSSFDVFIKSEKIKGMWRLSNFSEIPMTCNILGDQIYYFNNESELIGIFEKTAEILDGWVVDWVLSRKYSQFNVMEELEAKYKLKISLPNLEEELRKQNTIRYKPIRWKLT